MRNAPRRKGKSGHQRTGLMFPISRVHKLLRADRINKTIGKGSAVVLTAVLEYLTSEILELASQEAKNVGRKRVNARHIQLAICQDDELSKMLSGMIITQGGVKPNIHPELLKKKKGDKPQGDSQDGRPDSSMPI